MTTQTATKTTTSPRAKKTTTTEAIVIPADVAGEVRRQGAREQVKALGDALALRFLERRAVVDGLLTALVAREHVLMLGPPGTAKSELAEAACRAFDGRFFSTLCNRHQMPDEVVGHWDLKALQEDNRYVRRVMRRLPEADVAFLDEVFKGSSALLNTLLKMLNERAFENDGEMRPVPLRTVVAASNELPDEGDNLGAFHDRFLVRFKVDQLTLEKNQRAVFFGEHTSSSPTPTTLPRIDAASLDLLAEDARGIVISDEAKKSVLSVLAAVRAANVQVSDRRMVKAIKLLKARAAILGVPRITAAHLGTLADCFWNHPDQIKPVREIVQQHVASWVRDVAKADAAIDEQMARVSSTKTTTGKRTDSITALGQCLQAALEIAETLNRMESQHVEAGDEVARLRDRTRELQKEINAGMRTQGVGAVDEKKD